MGIKLNLKKTKYMATGDSPRNFELEDIKGIIEFVKEYGSCNKLWNF